MNTRKTAITIPLIILFIQVIPTCAQQDTTTTDEVVQNTMTTDEAVQDTTATGKVVAAALEQLGQTLPTNASPIQAATYRWTGASAPTWSCGRCAKQGSICRCSFTKT